MSRLLGPGGAILRVAIRGNDLHSTKTGSSLSRGSSWDLAANDDLARDRMQRVTGSALILEMIFIPRT
jgi:hypothetical protein